MFALAVVIVRTFAAPVIAAIAIAANRVHKPLGARGGLRQRAATRAVSKGAVRTLGGRVGIGCVKK
jgi:hypothetical protein